MAIEQLEYCTAETNIIASLADKPNAQSGMTAAQLKAKFDAADAAIKEYINKTLVPYVNETLGTMDTRLGEHDAAFEADDDKIVALKADSHTHENKELLDSYAQTEADLADAVTKKHEHTNKTALDTYNKTQTELLQLGCNPNLLDNWYFIGDGMFPVNQRGASSYSSAGYGIDRWIVESGASIALSSDGLTITSSANLGIVQKYETPAQINGKTGTVSLLLSNGALDAYTFTIGSLAEGHLVGEYDVYSIETAMLYVRATSATQHAIAAVKLELGTQQTLAHQDASGNWVLNEVPNYEEQFARCRRFYQVGLANYTKSLVGSSANGTIYAPCMQLSPPMRAAPTVTLLGVHTFSNGDAVTVKQRFASTQYMISALGVSAISDECIQSHFTASADL